MRNRPLGRTGLFVSELCLGTMTFGGGEGMWAQIGNLQQADAERLIGQALDAGINFIDTADQYSGGLAEQITGQALKNLKVPRESVVVATKVVRRDGARAEHARRLARPHPRRRESESEAPSARSHRPLSDSCIRCGDTDRRNDARARSAGAPRPRSLHRCIQLGRVANRQGGWHRRTARSDALGIAAGLLHDCRPRPRARNHSDAAQRRDRPVGVEPACRRIAQRQVRARTEGQNKEAGARPSTFRR